MSFQGLKEQIAIWVPLVISVALLIALFVWLGRAGLILLSILVGVVGIVHLLRMIDRRLPRISSIIMSVGSMLLLAIAAVIVLGGIVHSCTRGPNDCTSGEARFGLCD